MNQFLREEIAALLAEAPLPPPMPLDVQFPPVDVSSRARTIRAIVRIADAHSWHSAITHFLESRACSYLSDLTDPQLEDLHDRMLGYVDAAEMGCSLEHCLPAT